MLGITSSEQEQLTLQEQEPKVKVLYVVGAARSGTTLLSVVLDHLSGFFAGIEIENIWQGLTGNIPGLKCGCGKPYVECELWQTIFNDAFGGIERVNPRELLRSQMANKGRLSDLLPFNRTKQRYQQASFKDYCVATEALYRAMQNVTHSRVIVDASKGLPYLQFLSTLHSIDLYVLHIVRDPRGVVFSQLHNPRSAFSQENNLNRVMYKGLSLSKIISTPTLTAIRWARLNVTAELLSHQWGDKYMRIRYEDLVANPKFVLGKVIEFTGEDQDQLSSQLPLTSEHEVLLGENHSVGGNRMRFQRGVTELRLDEKWKSEMKPLYKVLVNLFTWPVLLKYGYRLFPAQPQPQQTDTQKQL